MEKSLKRGTWALEEIVRYQNVTWNVFIMPDVSAGDQPIWVSLQLTCPMYVCVGFTWQLHESEPSLFSFIQISGQNRLTFRCIPSEAL